MGTPTIPVYEHVHLLWYVQAKISAFGWFLARLCRFNPLTAGAEYIGVFTQL